MYGLYAVKFGSYPEPLVWKNVFKKSTDFHI